VRREPSVTIAPWNSYVSLFNTRRAAKKAPKAAQWLLDVAVYVYTAAASHVDVDVVDASVVLVVTIYDESDGSTYTPQMRAMVFLTMLMSFL
jgi:hypothetical protein